MSLGLATSTTFEGFLTRISISIVKVNFRFLENATFRVSVIADGVGPQGPVAFPCLTERWPYGAGVLTQCRKFTCAGTGV